MLYSLLFSTKHWLLLALVVISLIIWPDKLINSAALMVMMADGC